jgi:hypothetical protein
MNCHKVWQKDCRTSGTRYASGVKKLVRERGRPPIPEEERRTVRINVFVTRAEYEQLAKEAQRAGTSVVDLVRERALKS